MMPSRVWRLARWSEGELTDALALTMLYHMNDLAPALARLTPRQRRDLIEDLSESLEDKDIPVTDAQRADLDGRIADVDQDRDHSIPWDHLNDELRDRRSPCRP